VALKNSDLLLHLEYSKYTMTSKILIFGQNRFCLEERGVGRRGRGQG
jgi:hypothetical protein